MLSRIRIAVLLPALLLFCAPFGVRAEDTPPALPAAVTAQVKEPLARVGDGNYRKYGFKAYNASLWAADGNWDPQKAYALHLRYARDVSNDTMVETVAGNIRSQNVADEPTMAQWREVLVQSLPAVKEEDELTGVFVPGKKSLLFHNGKQIAKFEDDNLSKAFFNVWLGDKADEGLKAKLTGKDI